MHACTPARLGGVWGPRAPSSPARLLSGPSGPSGPSAALWAQRALSGRSGDGGMPAGRHVTPGICEEDRKHAKYITQIWRGGAQFGNLSATGLSAVVVRVETWGCSGWITSRETFYIIPRPIHWATSTSCPLDSTTALPSTRSGRPGSRLRPRLLPFPGISASRSPAGNMGHPPVPALVIR